MSPKSSLGISRTHGAVGSSVFPSECDCNHGLSSSPREKKTESQRVVQEYSIYSSMVGIFFQISISAKKMVPSTHLLILFIIGALILIIRFVDGVLLKGVEEIMAEFAASSLSL